MKLMAQHEGQNDLKRTMKSRHLFMVSLGGVIGTGFAVGWLYWLTWVVTTAMLCSLLLETT
ncbi:hypothetical protein SAMN05880580_12056 [Priestia flexa]|nr:hypothetical protein SAMN05880580_12056 [Priestia flexa]